MIYPMKYRTGRCIVVEGGRCSSVDASRRREVPWRRCSRSMEGEIPSSTDGVESDRSLKVPSALLMGGRESCMNCPVHNKLGSLLAAGKLLCTVHDSATQSLQSKGWMFMLRLSSDSF